MQVRPFSIICRLQETLQVTRNFTGYDLCLYAVPFTSVDIPPIKTVTFGLISPHLTSLSPHLLTTTFPNPLHSSHLAPTANRRRLLYLVICRNSLDIEFKNSDHSFAIKVYNNMQVSFGFYEQLLFCL